jgi:hypothetical protein
MGKVIQIMHPQIAFIIDGGVGDGDAPRHFARSGKAAMGQADDDR